MMSRKCGVFPLTSGLIFITSALFFTFDCPFLVAHLTVFIPVVAGLLFVFVVISLFHTSFTDPGISPRALPDETADPERQTDKSGSSSSPPLPRTNEILINAQLVKLKYCFTCKMFRPPRSSHCSLCDNCVERFDHHCPWVGNCVGKRNYRFFYMFIVSLSLLTSFIFGCVITHLVLRSQRGNGIIQTITETPASVAELLICFFSIWSILGFSGFHTYLVASNLTTNENIKGSWSSKRGQKSVNPYSYNSLCVNCCVLLCGPMPPSLIDRRGFLSPDVTPQTLADKNDAHVCTDSTKQFLESVHSSVIQSTCADTPNPPPDPTRLHHCPAGCPPPAALHSRDPFSLHPLTLNLTDRQPVQMCSVPD